VTCSRRMPLGGKQNPHQERYQGEGDSFSWGFEDISILGDFRCLPGSSARFLTTISKEGGRMVKEVSGVFRENQIIIGIKFLKLENCPLIRPKEGDRVKLTLFQYAPGLSHILHAEVEKQEEARHDTSEDENASGCCGRGTLS
jgi:hypothetical protein